MRLSFMEAAVPRETKLTAVGVPRGDDLGDPDDL